MLIYPTCPCKWCGKPTPMTGTKQCDPCWNTANAVQSDPELALRVLTELGVIAPDRTLTPL
jgi:hypothetical protein